MDIGQNLADTSLYFEKEKIAKITDICQKARKNYVRYFGVSLYKNFGIWKKTLI